jgi:hypothetical protein
VELNEPQISEYSEWKPAGYPGRKPSARRWTSWGKCEANPEGRPAVITVKSDPAASLIVNLGRENTVFVNPYTGELLGGLSATHNLLHEIVD